MRAKNQKSSLVHRTVLTAVAAFLWLNAASASAAGKVETTVFGPATFFDIGNGAKQTKSFSISNTGLPFTLRFQNNGADHAQIKLNGKLLQSNGLIQDPKLAKTFSVTLGTTNEVEVKVTGPGTQSSITLLLTATTGELPPDPVTVAPPVDPSIPTTVANSTSFLYTGSNPIQKGVAQGTIQPHQATLLRGRVLDPAGNPLPGVSVSVQNRPEFGITATSSTGEYNLAVNGGTRMTVNFALPGYLSSSRSALPPQNHYVPLADLILVPLASSVGRVELGATAIQFQVLQSSTIQTTEGNRKITLLVPSGTSASLIPANGSPQILPFLSVRATDLTSVGDGIGGLPAELPKELANTYGFDLSADEAISAGGATAQFNQPILQYVENFLDLPTGTAVPLKYYDRRSTLWMASTEGVNIQILSVAGGTAVIDTRGMGQPASGSDLAALGITAPELQELATLYPAGAKLSRLPIYHFTTYYFAYQFAGFADGTSFPTDYVSSGPIPSTLDRNKIDQPSWSRAPSVEIENQVLRESIPIVGTPYTLNYASDRNRGRASAYQLVVPITPQTAIPGLTQVNVEVSIAGKVTTSSFVQPPPNFAPEFSWDGRDVFGRQVQGAVPALITILKTFQVPILVRFYFASNATSFSSFRYTYQELFDVPVGTFSARASGLGGFSLSRVHHFDPVSQVLYLGTGERQAAKVASLAITTGRGEYGFGQFRGRARRRIVDLRRFLQSRTDRSRRLHDHLCFCTHGPH